MLELKRRHFQKIYIGPDITVQVVAFADGVFTVAIDAPEDVQILRDDVRTPYRRDRGRKPNGQRRAIGGPKRTEALR